MYSQTIGIYMPSKNRCELLKRAVESVRNQTYTNWKLIVVNDGSTDDTKRYLDSIDDPRIQAIHHEVSIGACAARNKAISTLDTELVTGLDDDDVFLPQRLEQLLSVYDDSYSFVCSGYFWDYGFHKKQLFNKDKVISLSQAFDLNQCSNQILVKRERILQVGCFDETIPALQDHDLWVRLIAEYGDAFRTGEPSYVVNDDHSIERISSVNNKLEAIAIFEEKHSNLMSERNKENFKFYRDKISGEHFGLKRYLPSLQHGLWGAKTRQFFSSCFESISQRRLNYLKSGRLFEHELMNKVATTIFPLVATGGTGASRVVLLSIMVFLFGPLTSASFSQDIFIILLLNTLLCQSFSFYFYKDIYRNCFNTIFIQSISGLILTVGAIIVLYYAGIVNSPVLSIFLATALHMYFMFRVKLLSLKCFIELAFIEIAIALFCLTVPIIYSNLASPQQLPYLVYSIALLAASLVMSININRKGNSESKIVPFKNVVKVAVANGVGPTGLFLLPTIVGIVGSQQDITIAALCISFGTIVFLIPRAFANTFMPSLGDKSFSHQNIISCHKKYQKVVAASAIFGWALSIIYLIGLTGTESINSILFLSGLSILVLALSQFGFVLITLLNLRGKEDKVLKVHGVTFILTIAVFIATLTLSFEKQSFAVAFVFVSLAVAYLVRHYIARRIYSNLFEREA